MPDPPNTNDAEETAKNERFLTALLNPPPQFPEGEDYEGWRPTDDLTAGGILTPQWWWTAQNHTKHAKFKVLHHEAFNPKACVSPTLAALLEEDYDRTLLALKTIKYMHTGVK